MPQHNLHNDTGSDSAERRSTQRKSLMMRMDISLANNRVLPAHAVDLSVGGLGFVSPEPLNTGHEIAVSLPFAVFGEERVLNLQGEVCYCTRTSPGQYRVGLRFVRLDAATMAFIHSVCA